MSPAAADLRRALARGTGYRLLAHLLSPPGSGWVDDARALAAEAGIPERLLPECTDDEALLEHQRVFYPTGSVSPCASDHVAEGFVGKGSVLGDVAGFYRAFGYEPELREPPDHFASMFGFLALLAMKEAAMTHEGNEEEADVARSAETDLLATHVLPRLDPFRTRLAAVAPPEGVYRKIGRVLAVRLVDAGSGG